LSPECDGTRLTWTSVRRHSDLRVGKILDLFQSSTRPPNNVSSDGVRYADRHGDAGRRRRGGSTDLSAGGAFLRRLRRAAFSLACSSPCMVISAMSSQSRAFWAPTAAV